MLYLESIVHYADVCGFLHVTNIIHMKNRVNIISILCVSNGLWCKLRTLFISRGDAESRIPYRFVWIDFMLQYLVVATRVFNYILYIFSLILNNTLSVDNTFECKEKDSA